MLPQTYANIDYSNRYPFRIGEFFTLFGTGANSNTPIEKIEDIASELPIDSVKDENENINAMFPESKNPTSYTGSTFEDTIKDKTGSKGGDIGGSGGSEKGEGIIPSAVTCGSAHNTITSSKPEVNLCSDNSSPNVLGSGPWTWTCGTEVACIAPTKIGDNMSTTTGQEALYAGVYQGRTLWVAHAGAAGQTILGQNNPHSNLKLQWKINKTATSNASNTTDGMQNTGTRNNSHPASNYCQNLEWAGHTDWYLPAAQIAIGTTPNCSSQPGELQFLYCQHKGTGNESLLKFSSEYYWSSTEYNTGNARVLHFINGALNFGYKDANILVRCVRVADKP